MLRQRRGMQLDAGVKRSWKKKPRIPYNGARKQHNLPHRVNECNQRRHRPGTTGYLERFFGIKRSGAVYGCIACACPLTTVAVCICTFKNPDGLRDLLQGLDTQLLETVRDEDLTVAVVDNDAGASAAKVLKSYATSGRFKLSSLNQPKRGLSSARNSALHLAFASQADLFAFLDDDEIPSDRWLQSMVDCFKEPGNAIIVGPLEPRFEVPPPRWIVAGDFFHHRCTDSNDIAGYTGNVMMRTAAIAASGVRFDEALNAIGGEDVVFFRALRARGFDIKCSPGALAYESIPRGRASLKWMMRRWLRAGATGTLLMGSGNVGWRNRIANAARGLGRIGAGSIMVVVTATTRGRRDFAAVARSIATVCRGVGMLIAAFGISYQEYGQGYRRDT
ncbi:MAG: succinoglycan biosynthesis protein ExoM [Gammaproteobacteria bacterium]|nr:succinoglycan biosynthesis protein ExoM [Gammaproteobacteria bacterium]